MADLLLEIGCEELPAGYIRPALEQWAGLVRAALDEARLGCAGVKTAGTPRRLAVFAAGVREAQHDALVEVTGPPARAAFDAQGSPTKAALGFARTHGVEPSALSVKKTPKGEYCVVQKEVKGRPAADVLAEALPRTITSIRFPKSMHWVTGSGVTFARPFRTLLALLGSLVIEFEINGVRSGRATAGHPFLSPGLIELPDASFDGYLDLLRAHRVVADIPARREIIARKIGERLAAHGSKLTEMELLDEVTNLVEFPNIVEGAFDEKFLALPQAVLEESMKSHQRYFPVHDAAGRMLPRFITVINRDDGCAAVIREGNQRVLRARLADAEFFLHEDTRRPLAGRLEQLKGVTFQAQLGSYYDKVQRLKALAEALAAQAGLPPAQAALCVRAAELCKNDLVTAMVGEFPRLQGIIGREYAVRDGEDAEVAAAIAEHYAPRTADDALPATVTGSVLSIAEKFDTIAGCFSVGLAPTGSQDPYALRRAAQGIIRILMEGRAAVSLAAAVAEAAMLQPRGLPQAEGVQERILAFLRDRLYNYLTDKGYRYDQVNAVLAAGFDDVRDVRERLEAVASLAAEPGWEDLVTVVQRTFNIIRNSDVAGDVDEGLLCEPQERELWAILKAHEGAVRELAAARKYRAASELFARAFVASVHEFFERVFVNVDDAALRRNRLALMKRINSLYTERIADLSQIVIAEGP